MPPLGGCFAGVLACLVQLRVFLVVLTPWSCVGKGTGFVRMVSVIRSCVTLAS